MITISYLEHYSQDGIEKYVFYTYKEFFQFWSHHNTHGRISLIGHTEMEEEKYLNNARKF